jgi:REP element-mobilizing transposase RayT
VPTAILKKYNLKQMNITANETFHIFNQGNNQETLFYEVEDYREFLKFFKKFVFPHAKILAYCLMPNHFHFLIHATEDSTKIKRVGNIDLCALSNGFRLLQSNYAQYINKKHNRSGSLFRQKTKAKSMLDGDEYYEFIAFQYIHQNPLKAGLVTRMENWEYSSFSDYCDPGKESFCDRELAYKLIGFDKENFIKEAYKTIGENSIKKYADGF